MLEDVYGEKRKTNKLAQRITNQLKNLVTEKPAKIALREYAKVSAAFVSPLSPLFGPSTATAVAMRIITLLHPSPPCCD